MSTKTLTLSELFTPTEISSVVKMLKANEEVKLKAWLNQPTRKKKLEDKGVVADYLYYVIQYNKQRLTTK